MQQLIVLTEEQLKQVIAETVKAEIDEGVSNLIRLEPKAPAKPDILLTRKEAASFLGVSLPTLNSWTKDGIIKGYRINSRVRYKRVELEEALSEIGIAKSHKK